MLTALYIKAIYRQYLLLFSTRTRMTHKLFIIIFYFIQCTFAQTQHTHSGSMTEMDEPVPAFNATGDEPMSYALFPDNKTYFYIHVAMMTIAFWVLMPIGNNRLQMVKFY